jgi:hypothetical protein
MSKAATKKTKKESEVEKIRKEGIEALDNLTAWAKDMELSK